MLVSEQYTKGLGRTVAELAERFPEGVEPVEKLRFSACGVEAFDAQLAASGCRDLGRGRHRDARLRQPDGPRPAGPGHEVHVAADAVSSRAPANRAAGLEKMAAAGARITSAEMALFELLEAAGPTSSRRSRGWCGDPAPRRSSSRTAWSSRGRSVAAPGTALGEMVFTTGMTGYQEAVTDPSYLGQILCFTAPMIGNYGAGPGARRERPPLAGRGA